MNNPNKKAVSGSGSNTSTAATACGGDSGSSSGGDGMYGGMAGDEPVDELSDDEEYGSHFFGKPDNPLLKPQKFFFLAHHVAFTFFQKSGM